MNLSKSFQENRLFRLVFVILSLITVLGPLWAWLLVGVHAPGLRNQQTFLDQMSLTGAFLLLFAGCFAVIRQLISLSRLYAASLLFMVGYLLFDYVAGILQKLLTGADREWLSSIPHLAVAAVIFDVFYVLLLVLCKRTWRAAQYLPDDNGR